MPHNRRPPQSPLGEFIEQFVDEIILPRADQMAETLTGWFDRMIEQAESQASARIGGESVKNTQSPRARSKRSATKPPPKDRPKAKVPAKPRGITAYTVLGVDPKAPQEVLAAAYKALARMYHPDVGGRYGAERMKTVNMAWEMVKDPERRRKYDVHGTWPL